MKKMLKKKIYLIVPVFVLVVLLCFWGVHKMTEDRLSEEQIAELREEYPICCVAVPPTIYYVKPTLKEIKEQSESYIYCEVVGEMSTHYVNASTGKVELDEKRKANGINDVFEFYAYTVVVIDDTEGKYKKGETVTIAANAGFKDYDPKLSDGMKIVCPVSRDKKNEWRSYFGGDGTYYVTDDGYAISAFEETSTYSRRSFSVIKVEELLKE